MFYLDIDVASILLQQGHVVRNDASVVEHVAVLQHLAARRVAAAVQGVPVKDDRQAGLSTREAGVLTKYGSYPSSDCAVMSWKSLG